MYGHIIGLIVSPMMGPMYDFIKIYKLIVFVNTFLTILFVLMVISISMDDCINHDLYDACFVVITGIFACSFMGSVVILTKLVDKMTRGTILTLMGLCGAIAQTIFIPVNKSLYNNSSTMLPFIIAIIFYVITTVIIFTFGVTGRLKM